VKLTELYVRRIHQSGLSSAQCLTCAAACLYESTKTFVPLAISIKDIENAVLSFINSYLFLTNDRTISYE